MYCWLNGGASIIYNIWILLPTTESIKHVSTTSQLSSTYINCRVERNDWNYAKIWHNYAGYVWTCSWPPQGSGQGFLCHQNHIGLHGREHSTHMQYSSTKFWHWSYRSSLSNVNRLVESLWSLGIPCLWKPSLSKDILFCGYFTPPLIAFSYTTNLMPNRMIRVVYLKKY